MFFAIPFPAIDPVAVEIGPIAIRWYALAYLVGLVVGWLYARRLATLPPRAVSAQDVDDFLTWATLGVVLGGRLGYVLFYKAGYYLDHPLQALQIWQGGMSFHGGLLGVIVAGVLFCRVRRLPTLAFADLIFTVAPLGLCLGRIANFINGELPGRIADVPWAMAFPGYGPFPRHPSQLYQAAMEGLLLLIILAVLAARPSIRARPGLLSGAFLVGYGVFRIIGEVFREPDAHLGLLLAGATMGQLLSLPMLVIGGILIARALRRPPLPLTP
ncbi:MAG: prolipoprotein diacylglyceryl transferase [Rhodospirillales bacterium]|jgi:phosphatidylglycerol:prolipoprotein diacylglycerol transferase|nr:prolipoprotein diacylglyceryl transferase [Rhodospirillales bacterium]